MEVKWLEETIMGHESIGLLQARFLMNGNAAMGTFLRRRGDAATLVL